MSALTENAIPDIGSRMGRPPLGNVATQVRLSKTVMERIDALVGGNRRAAFIREAVDEKLRRDESRERQRGE